MDQIKIDPSSVNLNELAEAILQLQRKTDFILQALKLEYIDDPSISIPPDLVKEISALLRQGKKMQAIQAYRSRLGGFMEDAKAAVEKIEKRSTRG